MCKKIILIISFLFAVNLTEGIYNNNWITANAAVPAAPLNVTANNEGIQIVSCAWDAPNDPTIINYVFGIGRTPGAADIKWWQVINRTKTYFYPLQYNLKEGDVVYISVRSYNGSYSDIAASNPVSLSREFFGDPANNITVAFADYGFGTDGVTPAPGWTAEKIARFQYFTERMIPIIKEIYGPPAHNRTITFVRDLYYSRSNIYLPQYNEIHMDDSWYPQLLTHELIHAFRDNLTITTDTYFRYDNALSGFEEGFAQGVSYACMNRYNELYPADPYVPVTLWCSNFEWDYDFQNTEELRTTDLWSDSGGTGIYWLRYEMAAEAIRKIKGERADFYSKFNETYYNRLNLDPLLRSSRSLVIDIITQLVPQIEGVNAQDWINQQYIFDCQIHPGKKIWVRTQHYPYWQDYHINQWLNYYETFPNGNEWAYWDGTQWIYHHLNGTAGTGILYDFNNNIVWQSNLLIEPIDNPPVYFGFGWERKNLINLDNSINFPAADYIGGLHTLSLYKMDITFDQTAKTIYRVMGDALVNSRGVWGGIIGAQGGVIYIDHEGFPPEPPLPVINGAFHGIRSWAGIYNSMTRWYDTVPGKVNISYVDQNNNVYTKQVNIEWGSVYGNHAFLLDVRPTNKPPVLAPIGSKIVDEGNSLQFVLSAADPEGDALTYSVMNLPIGASFDPISKTFNWIPEYSQSGIYNNVHFEVNDGKLSASEDITITVNNVNRAPALDAMGNKMYNEGEVVGLNLTASDPDGDTVTFSAQGLPAELSINPATGVVSGTLGYSSAGTYAATFTVSDGILTASEAVSIMVNNVNLLPTVNAGADQVVAVKSNVSFNGSASQDSDGSIVRYSWNFGDGFSGSGVNPTHIYNTTGSYTVTLTVTDNDGAQASDTSIVTVKKKMYAASITLSLVNSKTTVKAKAVVKVVDENGLAVSNTHIYGRWSGLTGDSDNFFTNTKGLGTAYSNDTAKSSTGTWTFTIDNIVYSIINPAYVYDAASNVETSDSIVK